VPVKCHGRPPGAQRRVEKNIDWLTPPALLVALGALRVNRDGDYRLGADPFDADYCASVRQPWPTARRMYTRHEDGTQQDWQGEVFLNPPYGLELYCWLARLASHGSGVALLYARTDTVGFHTHVWNRADAVYFFAGRLWFHKPVSGEQAYANCGGPMCAVAFGRKSVDRLAQLTDSDYPGRLVMVKHKRGGKR
jgi:hypothetical protein